MIMGDLVKMMSNMDMFVSSGAVDDNLIKEAEERLELKFADEYREYVLAYGTASYYGHELTGICEGDDSVSVVSVTIAERPYFTNISKEWYVIEQTHVDGIVIWQDVNGCIYKATQRSITKICNSLKEYVVAG